MSRKKHKKSKNLALAGIIDVLALGIATATLLGFLGKWSWIFDLFSHFRVQYMQLCLVLVFIALWKRMHKRAAALVLLGAINYAFVLPLYFGKPNAPVNGKPIRAMLMNLNAGNGNTEQVLEPIAQFAPDILLLEEVTPKWADELEMLNTTYPHRVAAPQAGCFGIMLISKHPLEHGQVVQIGDAGVPSIIADIHFPSGVLSFIGTHPLPPLGAQRSALRNQQLAELPRFVAEQSHPVLLVGDLNVSPWSSHFTRLVKDSGLKNSMKGFGFQPSWPSRMWLLRIPLDHVLYSAGITIHHRMVGGDVGSDHYPVIVDFSID